MRIVPIPAFRDNYIWALCADGRCAVVDPGEAAPVIAFMEREGLALAAILVTHRHNDHVGGVLDLLARSRGVPVFGPAAEPVPGRAHALVDGDTVDLDSLGRYRVMDVPGHTEGHIAYVGEGALFCGDTLFAAGCGRLLGGTAPQLHASLARLASLSGETRVYCAHEYTLSNLRFARTVEPENPALLARQQACADLRERGLPTVPSTIDQERATNPFLRSRQPAVRASAENHAQAALEDDLAVFTALRAWKDNFQG